MKKHILQYPVVGVVVYWDPVIFLYEKGKIDSFIAREHHRAPSPGAREVQGHRD